MTDDDRPKDEEPRIVRVDRRRFLGRAAAAATAGVAARQAVGRRNSHEKQETTLDRFRLMVEARAFTHPVRELYPVLGGSDPRLVATSTDDWLGIWALDEGGDPRFKGRQRSPGDVKLCKATRGFRRAQGRLSAVSEDGKVVAWYEHRQRRVRVFWEDGRVDAVTVPEDRGIATVLGLGPKGEGLAVAMELGGMLVFDLRESVHFVGEFADSKLAIHHLCQVGKPCDQWGFAPCLCDVVSAQSSGEYSGAAVSQYDKETGLVTTSVMPCGTPLPAGAVCVCNCVAFPATTVVSTICTCNLVCTCNTVSTSTTYTYTYTYWYPN